MHRSEPTISTSSRRTMWRSGAALAIAGALVACVTDPDNPAIPQADAGPDAQSGHDSGVYDAGIDSTVADAAPDAPIIPDATVDAGHDANVPDTHVPDSNVADTNLPDTNVADTNMPDTNMPDTNMPDTNTPDTNMPDTNVVDSAGPPPGGLGPTAYLSFADSPFNGTTLGYFYLEDFEDHALDTPGVTANGQTSSSTGTTSLIDSVDGDDGDPTDGKCIKDGGLCDAWFSGAGDPGITFTFNAATLGALPTHVGIVWTDGGGTISFKAYDAAGLLVGSVGPSSDPPIFPDNSFYGTTGEDRFFGIVYPSGVSIDHHLQYVGRYRSGPFAIRPANRMSANG